MADPKKPDEKAREESGRVVAGQTLDSEMILREQQQQHSRRANDHLEAAGTHPNIAQYKSAMSAINAGDLTRAATALQAWNKDDEYRRVGFGTDSDGPSTGELLRSVYRTYLSKGGKPIDGMDSSVWADYGLDVPQGVRATGDQNAIQAYPNIQRKVDERLK